MWPGDAVAVGREVDGDEIEAVGAGEQCADAAANHGEGFGVDVDLKHAPLEPETESSRVVSIGHPCGQPLTVRDEPLRRFLFTVLPCSIVSLSLLRVFNY